jgi:predicted dehydrogenase
MDSLDAGAHVIVEKPATSTFEELEALARHAQAAGRCLIEDHNYVFNRAPQEMPQLIKCGEFGAVTHVEILICLDILGPSGFADPNSPHPAFTLPGGAIADFLPHLASLAHLFIGPHRTAQTIWTKRKTSHILIHPHRFLAPFAHQPSPSEDQTRGEPMAAGNIPDRCPVAASH